MYKVVFKAVLQGKISKSDAYLAYQMLDGNLPMTQSMANKLAALQMSEAK